MTDPRRPIAAIRYDANLAIDAAFVPLAEEAEAIVLRHARTGPEGVPRLDPFAVAMVRAELRRLLAGRQGELVAALGLRVAEAEALADRQAERVIERDG